MSLTHQEDKAQGEDRMSVRIAITGGAVTVDINDVPVVLKHGWYVGKNGYVMATVPGIYPEHKMMTLHRVLASPAPGQYVDHVNRDPLDNRRSNLRICDNKLNTRNRRPLKHNQSGFNGLSFPKSIKTSSKPIRVQITNDYKNIHVGNYATLEEALSARLFAESYYWGEVLSV